MWGKRWLLLAVGVGAVVPLWIVGHSESGTTSNSAASATLNATAQTIAAMQSEIATLQAKNTQAGKSLQQLQAKAQAWKTQNQKLQALLQTAQSENLTLQNAVQKWQAAASQQSAPPPVQTVTGASGFRHHEHGGDGFGD